LLGLIPLLNFAKTSEFDLEIISILFGGLLAVAAIIQSSWDSNTIKRLKISGHDKYLLEYITIPVYSSFILLVLQFFKRVISIPLPPEHIWLGRVIFAVVNFALLGILLLATFRLLSLIVPIIKKAND
jgi:hypothetical protein